jgi:Na+/H+ antiporter NhaD/arsenite permease-like protein
MEILITLTFIIGYIAIASEDFIKIDKAASALVTGVLCWTIVFFFTADKHVVTHQLMEQMGDISGILFFLLGAMTIVELIDAHDGFQLITEKITTKTIRKLLWIIALITFFLSAILDNLTTTIVIISMLRKIINDREQRLLFAGVTIIAANAGGAWSPLGDVTTTMLWIGGQITPLNIILRLFLPSLVCLLVPVALISFSIKGEVTPPLMQIRPTENSLTTTPFKRNFIFFLGMGIILFVPIFKTLTHLPPFMAMLLGLGIMWINTEIIYKKNNTEINENFTVATALQKIDTPSILFFLGILISISALQSVGLLAKAAVWLTQTIGNESMIVILIGLLSAVVDNVPLVAATQGMYSLQQYPPDSYLWEFLAYATGTGGSCLIIGSAAGVAAMGMEKIGFIWYFKRISWLALIGYFAGAFVYMIQYSLTH